MQIVIWTVIVLLAVVTIWSSRRKEPLRVSKDQCLQVLSFHRWMSLHEVWSEVETKLGGYTRIRDVENHLHELEKLGSVKILTKVIPHHAFTESGEPIQILYFKKKSGSEPDPKPSMPIVEDSRQLQLA